MTTAVGIYPAVCNSKSSLSTMAMHQICSMPLAESTLYCLLLESLGSFTCQGYNFNSSSPLAKQKSWSYKTWSEINDLAHWIINFMVILSILNCQISYTLKHFRHVCKRWLIHNNLTYFICRNVYNLPSRKILYS